MGKSRKTAEDACMEYAQLNEMIRAESAKISPWTCERIQIPATYPWHPIEIAPPPDPCISTLFRERDENNEGYQDHRDWQEEFEGEMCDTCKEILKHVRARRKLRRRLGYAKRAITIIGNRLTKASSTAASPQTACDPSA